VPRLQPSERIIRWGAVLLPVLGFAVFLLTIAALLWVASENDSLERRTDASDADRADLRADLEAQQDALDKANRRLIKAGEKPVTEPTPEAGPQGIPGLQGPPGEDGEPGPPGRRGRAGEDGTDGATGTNGRNGQDGERGPMGPPGPAGVDGTNGRDGEDGQSAFPFTFTFTVQQNPLQSTTYTVTCTVEACTVAESEPQ